MCRAQDCKPERRGTPCSSLQCRQCREYTQHWMASHGPSPWAKPTGQSGDWGQDTEEAGKRHRAEEVRVLLTIGTVSCCCNAKWHPWGRNAIWSPSPYQEQMLFTWLGMCRASEQPKPGWSGCLSSSVDTGKGSRRAKSPLWPPTLIKCDFHPAWEQGEVNTVNCHTQSHGKDKPLGTPVRDDVD